MKTFFVFLILSFCLFSSGTMAQWSRTQIDQVNDFNRSAIFGRRIFSGRYFLPLYDGLRNGWDAQYPGGQDLQISFDQDFFMSSDGSRRHLKVVYWKPRHKGVSPLIVYLPGLFEGVEDANSYQMVGTLLNAGYQVVSIPNAFAVNGEYLKNEPRRLPGAFLEEADIVLEVLRYLKSQHSDTISKIHVLGSSYGAFLASVVVGKDSENPVSLIDGQTTLVFPPVNLLKSIRVLDAWIDHEDQSSFSMLSAKGQDAYAFHGFLVDCLKLMQDLFRKDFAQALKARKYGELVQDHFKNLDLTSSAQRDSVRFESTLRNFAPENLKYFENQSGSLFFWLNLANEQGNERLQILTTADDWINPSNAWAGAPKWLLDPHHLLERATGGHAGMIGSSWFQNFLTSAILERH